METAVLHLLSTRLATRLTLLHSTPERIVTGTLERRATLASRTDQAFRPVQAANWSESAFTDCVQGGSSPKQLVDRLRQLLHCRPSAPSEPRGCCEADIGDELDRMEPGGLIDDEVE